MFLSLTKSGKCNKVMSGIYKDFQASKQEGTDDMRRKWEKEEETLVPVENWQK